MLLEGFNFIGRLIQVRSKRTCVYCGVDVSRDSIIDMRFGRTR